MNTVFSIVYRFLLWLSALTGLSYEAVNIVVYYYFIPALFCVLIDKVTKKHYFKVGFVIAVILSLIIIEDFEAFSQDLFDRSVDFLLLFNAVGLDYVQASVVICVAVPIAIIIYLRYLRKREQ